MGSAKLHKFTKRDEIGYFEPRSWAFWRSLIVCFCVFSLVGHWLEIPYCLVMDACFGVVTTDYAVWSDPLYVPYWVYGIGAVVMTLVFEPLKESIVKRRKTVWGALLETFGYAVVLSAALELGIGLLINQPDANGVYPFWDNSQLPLNIMGQAWLVNDVAIGLVAVLYVWVLYPLLCTGLSALGPRGGNVALAVVLVAFAACCVAAYVVPRA